MCPLTKSVSFSSVKHGARTHFRCAGRSGTAGTGWKEHTRASATIVTRGGADESLRLPAGLGVAVVELLALRDARLDADASDAGDPRWQQRHVGGNRRHAPEDPVVKAELAAGDRSGALHAAQPMGPRAEASIHGRRVQ